MSSGLRSVTVSGRPPRILRIRAQATLNEDDSNGYGGWICHREQRGTVPGSTKSKALIPACPTFLGSHLDLVVLVNTVEGSESAGAEKLACDILARPSVLAVGIAF